MLSDYNLKDKRDARQFFNEVRQLFLDFNAVAENSDEYEKRKKMLIAKVEERKR